MYSRSSMKYPLSLQLAVESNRQRSSTLTNNSIDWLLFTKHFEPINSKLLDHPRRAAHCFCGHRRPPRSGGSAGQFCGGYGRPVRRRGRTCGTTEYHSFVTIGETSNNRWVFCLRNCEDRSRLRLVRSINATKGCRPQQPFATGTVLLPYLTVSPL